MKHVLQYPVAERNPDEAGWFDTDKGKLYWFFEEKEWSRWQEHINKAYPSWWLYPMEVKMKKRIQKEIIIDDETVKKWEEYCRKDNQIMKDSKELPKPMENDKFLPGVSYFAFHKPSREHWYIIGIDPVGDRVCAAGYPPSIGKLTDCDNFETNKPLTEEEFMHRVKHFGRKWL